MAHFAPVAPWQVYKALHEASVFPDAYLFLAHDVLNNQDGYRSIAEAVSKAPIRIMDNSVIELGVAEGLKPTALAAETAGADVIVFPDALEKSKETVELVLKAYQEYTSDREYFSRFEYMVVPQGETWIDWVECIEAIYRAGLKPDWIGIPRNIVPRIHSTRLEAVTIAKMLFPEVNIHLLGFSGNVLDDYLCANDYRVSSIDSAAPLRFGSQSQRNSITRDPGPRGDWWSTVVLDLEDREKTLNIIFNTVDAITLCDR